MSQAKLAFFLGLALWLFFLQGCAPSASGTVYTREQARKGMQVYYGTVQQVNEVTIEGTQSGVGTLAGGALGAGVGQTVGSGTGRTLSTVVGGVAGGLAGRGTEKALTTKTGLEIMVRLDNGEVLSIVQETDTLFQPGERVRILRAANGDTRVTH